MLILSRKPGDAILIDGGIRIVVLAADSGGVRLGIEAPTSVGIIREEVVQRIAEENRRAGTISADAGMLEGFRPKPPTKDGDEPGGGSPGS